MKVSFEDLKRKLPIKKNYNYKSENVRFILYKFF